MDLNNPSNSHQIDSAIQQAYLPESNHKELLDFLLKSYSVISSKTPSPTKTNLQLAISHLENKLNPVGNRANKIQIAILIVLVLTLLATVGIPLLKGEVSLIHKTKEQTKTLKVQDAS
jgi:hypothetical protein